MSKKLFVLTMAVVLVAIACTKTSGGPSDPTPVIAATPTPSSTPKPGSPSNDVVAPSAITVMAGGQPITAAEIYREVSGKNPELVQVSDGDGKVFLNGLNGSDVIRIVAPGYLMNRRMVSQMDPENTYSLRSSLGSPGLICRLVGAGKLPSVLPYDRVSVVIVDADPAQVDFISKYIEDFGRVIGIDIAIRTPVVGDTTLTVQVAATVPSGADRNGAGAPTKITNSRVEAGKVWLTPGALLYGRGCLHHEMMHALFQWGDLYPYGVGGDTSIMGSTNVEQTLTDWDLAVLAQFRSRPPGIMWEDTLPGVTPTGATCN